MLANSCYYVLGIEIIQNLSTGSDAKGTTWNLAGPGMTAMPCFLTELLNGKMEIIWSLRPWTTKSWKFIIALANWVKIQLILKFTCLTWAVVDLIIIVMITREA